MILKILKNKYGYNGSIMVVYECICYLYKYNK